MALETEIKKLRESIEALSTKIDGLSVPTDHNDVRGLTAAAAESSSDDGADHVKETAETSGDQANEEFVDYETTANLLLNELVKKGRSQEAKDALAKFELTKLSDREKKANFADVHAALKKLVEGGE